MKTIAVIPARGGSKRLKGKNIKMFAGKPLIAHSIEYALANTNYIEKVIVSTDNEEIKKASLEYGAEVIDRPKILSSDTASSVSVLNHVLDNISLNVDNVVLLQPTNPLRPSSLLSEAFRKFKNGNFDSLMTVTPISKKLGRIIKGHFLPYNYNIGQRSQELESMYFENGLLYIIQPSIIKQGRILGDNHFPFIMDHPYSMVDIDTEEDMKLAELILLSKKE